MSVKVMTRVWEQSKHSGSKLLALLAIADHADHDGVAWPGIPRIAQKARISVRQAKRVIQDLADSGELYIQTGGGRGHSNLYLVTVGLCAADLHETLMIHFRLSSTQAQEVVYQIIACHKKGDADVTFSKKQKEDKDASPSAQKNDIQGVKGDTQSTKGDIAVSPEPSITIMKPSSEPSGGGAPPPPPDYLTHVLAHSQNTDRTGIADSSKDGDRWLQYGDAAMKVYKELTDLYADRQVGKPAIRKLAGGLGFDLQKWRDSIASCKLGGVNPKNIACMIDTYHSGGDYKEMCRRRKDGQGGSHDPRQPDHSRDLAQAATGLGPPGDGLPQPHDP